MRHIEEIVVGVGPWQWEDDWDQGQRVYEWHRADLHGRVITQSAYVHVVELLDPNNALRFAPAQETLWEFQPVKSE
jgi:hypothetical protein